MHELEEYLLKERNLNTEEEKEAFINPDFEKHTHDPFLLSDMEKTVSRIKDSITKNEHIGIYTDYDADGIPGAVIFSDFLERLNYNNFSVYIPDRQIDGYGLSEKGIDFLKDKGAKLIITIDLGITGNKSVLYAKDFGIDVIITDHHLPHENLPESFAIVNPKKEGDIYPFKDLCGTGVIYKVICAFLEKHRDDFSVNVGFEKWLLDMVSLATLSDMVSLTGENRVFAYYGLIVLKKTKRYGLKKLFDLNFIKQENLNEDDITHTITPRINASSRMGDAYLSYRMLTTKDKIEAEFLAKELESLNKKRKSLVATIMKEIHKMSKSTFEEPIIVLGNQNFRPGVLGLVASKLVETYNKPVFIWGGSDEEDTDVLKGSCRAPDGLNIVEIMHLSSDIFSHYGGHSGAGGFAISKRNLPDLKRNIINNYLDNIHKFSRQKSLEKTEIKSFVLLDTNEKIIEITNKFAPFGLGNEKPIFRLDNISLVSFKKFGKGEEHLEMIFNVNNKEVKGISFFTNSDFYLRELLIGDKYTIIFNLEVSYFIRKELRMRVIDIY
jgi:single-stranded-DNA-specific exonuclease